MATKSEIEIQIGVILGCGDPESYWTWGHHNRREFVAALESASHVTGLNLKVPAHAEVYHAFADPNPNPNPDQDGWLDTKRQWTPREGFLPQTFVYWDEVDESTPFVG